MVVWEWAMNYKALRFNEAQRPPAIHAKGRSYADAVCAFDIETSRFAEIDQSVMYIWQFCIDITGGEDIVILGRTWQQFKHMCAMLQRALCGMSLRVWIHNASYEFQFLSGIYNFSNEEVFALESRQILYFTMYRNFEFHCSYKLFNMGLSAATAKYAPDYHKRDGREFGYDERRFYDTELTRKELLYCVYDVWGLCKAVRGIMALFNDNLYTIPNTATGYVRREVKREMREYYPVLKGAFPSMEVYSLLRAAFRGGNTHASRFYANEILHDVKSVDISSSYPSQQCCKEFPITEFRRCYDGRLLYLDLQLSRGAAALIHCVLRKVELQNPFIHIPYLATGKCIKAQNVKADNGRILSADEIEIVITDIDYKIIASQYNFQYEMLDLFFSWYGKLPLPLIDINRRYFTAKTELKGVDGQELYYMKSKNLLNAIYGMSVMDQIKFKILYNNGEYGIDMEYTAEQLLKRAAKQPYTLYQYGVWTTAHARADLQRGIDICGDNIVYVDTDSCKYIGEADFNEYNEDRQAAAIKNGACATDKHGVVHYMGVYEDDGIYNRFVTLGAKKYAYEDQRGLHITIAGVPKITGAQELERKGGLESFKRGFIFSDTGKLEAVYNDGTLRGVEIDGHVIDITKNVCLRPTTYALDITDEYACVLDESAKMLQKVRLSLCKMPIDKNK